jgi:hypothetical protein
MFLSASADVTTMVTSPYWPLFFKNNYKYFLISLLSFLELLLSSSELG